MPDQPIRILVVEDSESDYELLSLRLAQRGLQVELGRVETEADMRKALAAQAPDLVICDHKLPRFSLAGALRVLREHDPDIPLIVVSGAIGEEAAVDAMIGGAEDFIVKGNLSRLGPAITRSLAAAETRRRERLAEAALRERESRLRLLVIEAKRAEGEIRELTAHLERAKEAERADVAREIHDEIGAIFFGLKVDLAWLRKRIQEEPAIVERLQSIGAQLDSGVQASQRIVRSLRPAVLDFGVVGAAEWLAGDFAKRTGIACRFSAGADEVELAPALGTAVFRVMQESLTNITRHAGASEVTVRLDVDDSEVRLEVKDNGRGVASADLAKRTSFGVRGMRERALELGGAFEIGPAPKGGTRLSLRLPLRAGTTAEPSMARPIA